MARKGSPIMTKIARGDSPTQVEPTRKEVVATQCRHYWLLEPPSGPTSRAVCKLCGATREFSNATDDYIYEEEAVSSWKSGRYRLEED